MAVNSRERFQYFTKTRKRLWDLLIDVLGDVKNKELLFYPPDMRWEMGKQWWLFLRRDLFRAENYRDPTPAEEANWSPDENDKLFGYPVRVFKGPLEYAEPRFVRKPEMQIIADMPAMQRYIAERYSDWTKEKVFMSSTYRLICLSHDPAFVLDFEMQDREEAEVFNASSSDMLAGHQKCDIMLGRFSYPLVELGCLPTAGVAHVVSRGCSATHANVNWFDKDVVRLVWAALDQQKRAKQTYVVHAGGSGGSSSFVSHGSGGVGSVYAVGGGGGGGYDRPAPSIHNQFLDPFTLRCLTPQRIHRLRFEIGVEARG